MKSSRMKIKMKKIKVASPKKLHAGGSQGDDPASQTLTLHQRRRRGQFLRFYEATGDPCRGSAGPRRDDHPQAVVSASSHGTSSCIHHETHQEPECHTVIGLKCTDGSLNKNAI